MEKAVFNLNRVYMVNKSGMPTRPDLLPEPIQEPADLEEFLAIIRVAFQMASAAFFEDLHAFRAQPKESLVKLADRFDEVAEPLLTAGLMTTSGLALNLREHKPPSHQKGNKRSHDEGGHAPLQEGRSPGG